jgi:hypothetical protein
VVLGIAPTTSQERGKGKGKGGDPDRHSNIERSKSEEEQDWRKPDVKTTLVPSVVYV